MVSCFVYHKFPGVHKSWSLAVFATGRRDADNYIKAWFGAHPGVFSHEVKSGEVKASCGGTTEAASAEIRLNNERLNNG
jgi:hypothetical protein